eukprot:UN32539
MGYDSSKYGSFTHESKLVVEKEDRLGLTDINRIKELRYYSKYAVAAYGYPLYQLTNPCACCENPCCSTPQELNKDVICGDPTMLSNSDIRVF